MNQLASSLCPLCEVDKRNLQPYILPLLVFNGCKVDANQLFYQCHRFLAWWSKGFSNAPSSKDDDNLDPLYHGELKFNIDGAVNGSFGKAGIGSCLHNENSKLLLAFFEVDPTSVEITAILEAMKIFSKSRWACSSKLLLKTDSHLSVEWIKNLHACPSIFQQLISLVLPRDLLR
ncbi:hypothetical protein GQ457_09G012920 [Hibiscus cannabinus]